MIKGNMHGIRGARRRMRNSLNWLLTILAPLSAFGAALARCWPVLLMLVLGPAILTLVPQGRQALFVAGTSANSESLAMCYIYGTALLVIGIYPMILLDTVRTRTFATNAWLYAKYTVPQLITVTAAYALPLLLRYQSHIDTDYGKPGEEAYAALGGMAVLLEFVAVAAVCVPAGMMMQDAKSKQAAAVFPSLFLIGIAWVVPVLFFDPQAVFTRYLCLIGGIVLANWVFSDAYELAHVRRKWLKNLASVLLIFAVIMLWITVRLAVAPSERAPSWGPFSVVLIAMLGWLSIAYIIDWIIWRLARSAVFHVHPAALGVLRFAVFGFIAFRLATGAFGNTAVNTLPVAAAPRATLAQYLDDWLKERQPAACAPPYPVFIVTAEGGGIRAAYWTANVLAALHDSNPQFSDHVLALSGVSGGSMGTSVYAALAAGGKTTPACSQQNHVQACAQAIGGADLLSSPLAAMLLSEPFNRITARIPGADRAAALDHALEHAWLTTMGDNRFASPFGDVAARRMLVLPNATSAQSAQRLVITPLAGDKEFANAQTVDGRAFYFSTATLLSARFPGLSPAGVYTPEKSEPMRIVDGGYSDNSGTATGAEVLSALSDAIDRAKLRGRFKPVVIAISNGSEVVEKPSINGLRSTALGLALDPVATLESVRVSASKHYEAALCTQVTAQNGEYLRVRLLHSDAEFPLGWMLAPATTKTMNGRLDALAKDGKSDFNRAAGLLREQGKENVGAAAPASPFCKS